MPRSPRSQPRGHVSRPWPREGRGEPGSCACSRERLPWRRHGHRRSSRARGRGRGSEMFPGAGGATSVCLLVQDAVTIILLSHHHYSSPIAATLGLTRSRGRVWAGRTQRVRRGSARGVGLPRGPRNASPRTRSATVPISSARFRGVSGGSCPPFEGFVAPAATCLGHARGASSQHFSGEKPREEQQGRPWSPGSRAGPEVGRRPGGLSKAEDRGPPPSALRGARAPETHPLVCRARPCGPQ